MAGRRLHKYLEAKEEILWPLSRRKRFPWQNTFCWLKSGNITYYYCACMRKGGREGEGGEVKEASCTKMWARMCCGAIKWQKILMPISMLYQLAVRPHFLWQYVNWNWLCVTIFFLYFNFAGQSEALQCALNIDRNSQTIWSHHGVYSRREFKRNIRWVRVIWFRLLELNVVEWRLYVCASTYQSMGNKGGQSNNLLLEWVGFAIDEKMVPNSTWCLFRIRFLFLQFRASFESCHTLHSIDRCVFWLHVVAHIVNEQQFAVQMHFL